MRARIIRALPAFAHFYGIRPWELERLSAAEVMVFLEQLPEG